MAAVVAPSRDGDLAGGEFGHGNGAHAGTPAYMSPEQLRGLNVDARSDVWALGVVLYELAAGTRPFAGQTVYEISSAILGAPPRPLPVHVTPNLRVVIERCLDKEPAARFQTAEEVLSALEERTGRAPQAVGQRKRTR